MNLTISTGLFETLLSVSQPVDGLSLLDARIIINLFIVLMFVNFELWFRNLMVELLRNYKKI